MNRLRELTEIEPPAFVDALVKERSLELLARHDVPTSSVRRAAGKGWRRLTGLLVSGGEALRSTARLLARALAG